MFVYFVSNKHKTTTLHTRFSYNSLREVLGSRHFISEVTISFRASIGTLLFYTLKVFCVSLILNFWIAVVKEKTLTFCNVTVW